MLLINLDAFTRISSVFRCHTPDVHLEGAYRSAADEILKLSATLKNQTRSVTKVAKAVALGDFSRRLVTDVQGELLDCKLTVNCMAECLGDVAREVFKVNEDMAAGQLGTQAGALKIVGGEWEKMVEAARTPALAVAAATH